MWYSIDWQWLINKSLNKSLKLIYTMENVMVDFCHHQCTHYKYYNYEWKAIRDRDQELNLKFFILFNSMKYTTISLVGMQNS